MVSAYLKPIGLICVVAIAAALYVRWHTPKTPQLPAPISEVTRPHATEAVIGRSVMGRDITAYTYGTGPTRLVFVGGMHGGYEWNSVVLAYKIRDYVEARENQLPKSISISIIPNINPDAVFAAVGRDGVFTETDVSVKKDLSTFRFNAHNVDLNRNFDCKWQPEGTWRGKKVSAGSAAFSEPESQALRNFLVKVKPVAVIFWHSQANAVYASECENGVLPETLTLMKTYATAAKYPAIESFDAYPVTGDAEGWLASIGTPAITVELSTHDSIEWDRNLAGFTALVSYYANK